MTPILTPSKKKRRNYKRKLGNNILTIDGNPPRDRAMQTRTLVLYRISKSLKRLQVQDLDGMEHPSSRRT